MVGPPAPAPPAVIGVLDRLVVLTWVRLRRYVGVIRWPTVVLINVSTLLSGGLGIARELRALVGAVARAACD